MPENVPAEAPSMTSLVTGIIEDAERLFRDEIALARREMQAELDKAKVAAAVLMIGMGSTAVGAVFLGLMIVFALNLVWPLWACFLLVGDILTLGGGSALALGVRQVRRISIVPRQAAETLRENVPCLQTQT
jgi:hypothetical protein